MFLRQALRNIEKYTYYSFAVDDADLELPIEIWLSIIEYLDVNSVCCLRMVCKNMYTLTQAYYERLISKIYWRISLEYHRKNDRMIVHSVNVSIGNRELAETCSYCAHQVWDFDGDGAYFSDRSGHVRSSDIKTTIVDGIGGQQIDYLLRNSSYCAILIIKSEEGCFPIFAADDRMIHDIIIRNRNASWTWEDVYPDIYPVSTPHSWRSKYIDIERSIIKTRRFRDRRIRQYISRGPECENSRLPISFYNQNRFW